MKIQCGQCNSALNVPDTAAGKRGKCPKCGAVVDVPALPLPSDTPSGPLATDKQKDFARSLGVDFSPDITKSAISPLIDKAIAQEDEERFKKLDKIEDRESKAYEEMRTEILAEIDEEDCRLSKATPAQMVEEMENRDHGAILISFPIDDVDFDNMAGAQLAVSFSDNLSEAEMNAVLFGLGAMMARQIDGS